MTYNNTYTHGQIWAQALKSGQALRQRLTPMLVARRMGHAVAHFTDVGSTNAVAGQWAADGAAEGALVVAEHQHEGRGRLGRKWMDAAGTNLMFSVVLRPKLKAEELGLIMLTASVSVSAALSEANPFLAVQIKWPNDVLINGKKCCGMLMETTMVAGVGARDQGVVVGIGVNVNQDEFPTDLASRATSLALESGRLFQRSPLLAAILNRFEEGYDYLSVDGGEAIRGAYLARLHGLNEATEVFTSDGGAPLRGRIRGISPVGLLLLETSDGIRSLSSGEITFRSAS